MMSSDSRRKIRASLTHISLALCMLIPVTAIPTFQVVHAPVYAATSQYAVSHKHELTNHQIGKLMKRFAHLRSRYHYTQISSNARDLGGYQTTDGRFIKPGMLIRSSRLSNMVSSRRRAFSGMHIKQIVDLRNALGSTSWSRHPDTDEGQNSFEGAVFKFAPVYTSNEYADHLQSGVKAHGEQYFYQHGAVTPKPARKAYRYVLMHALRNHKGAILYHCDLGRDRTGVMSAIILSALGVPRRTIYRDYLLTDYYHHTKPYTVQKHNLDVFFNTIHQHYGSMNNYLHTGLGMTNIQLDQLKSEYLTKRSGTQFRQMKKCHNANDQDLRRVQHEIRALAKSEGIILPKDIFAND